MSLHYRVHAEPPFGGIAAIRPQIELPMQNKSEQATVYEVFAAKA
jgi:hypothetical protein